MSVSMTVQYVGDLHCEIQHEPSAASVATDAPVDNAGRGSTFSPTDLVGAALASCALTTMAIRGAKEGIVLGPASGRVVKNMTTTPPRAIAELLLEVEMPPGLTTDQQVRLEEIARGC